MALDQVLMAAIVALAGVVGVLFKLLLSERQARIAFVEQKLTETELREKTHKDMLQAILNVTRAQVSGALPGPGETR